VVAGRDLPGLGQRPFAAGRDERAQRRVELVDPSQRGLDEVARGQLAASDQPGLLDGAEVERLGHGRIS
jgi:hypothetical protein